MQKPGDDMVFEAAARRASFGRWQGVNRLGEELLVWNYQLTPDQLPDWTPRQVQPLDAAGWPRSIQSTWSTPGGGLALVDVFECTSRPEAHRFLVRLLGHVESPNLVWQPEAATGDVLFSGERAPITLFARGNLLFFIRAADREPVPIVETAAQLDETIISKPEAPEAAAAAVPAIQRFAAALPEADGVAAAAGELRPGTSVALEVEAEDPQHRPLWYKAFSPTGELWLSEGRPVYQHTTDGPPDVTLYAISPGRGAARRSLELPGGTRRGRARGG